MKKIVFSVLLALSANILVAQTLSKADIVEDLTYLKNTLPEKHTNLFAKITKPAFDARVDAIIAKADLLDYDKLTAELFKLTVSIGDEHTFIEPAFNKILPVQFEFFKEGVFVTGIKPDNASLLFAQLVAINNKSTTTVIAAFKEALQHENPSYFDDHFLHFINNPAFLKGLGIIDSDDEAEFTFEGKDGKRINVKLASIAESIANVQLATANSALLAWKKKGNYWYDYDALTKTLYFNYNKCREEQDKPFEQFNNELFALIEAEKPEKIVLDLRRNSGGNSGILKPFINKIQASYLNKRGKFFVLIGKQTFSSAVMNAVDLKRNSKAIFIGEPTSGNINHYGEVRGFSLPKSKIVIAYSTKYWENWKGKKGPLTPDVPVTYSINNFIAGKDEALMEVYKK